MHSLRLLTPTLLIAALMCPVALHAESRGERGDDRHDGHDIRHVLLISIDGLHESDLDKLRAAMPGSTLDELMEHGVEFERAHCTKPSDSQPGILAMTTGGTPKSTGCFYDNSYDRLLFDRTSSTPGVNCLYDENVEFDSTRLDGGGGIDPTHLPLTAPLALGGVPVFPHSFLRTNTIFEVIRAAGMRTAWCDKSWGYEILNGPSGHGIDDLFVPEIKSGPDFTTTIPLVESYDDLKVTAVINQIHGLDHAGQTLPGGKRVPAILGMNFQAISVGQKLVVGGYQNLPGNPFTTNLAEAFGHTDASLGRMVAALKHEHLDESTLIIISAKHGQAPIDPTKVAKIGDQISGVVGSRAAHVTLDDVALIWLTPGAQPMTEQVVNDLLLPVNQAKAHIKRVIWGAEMAALYGDPRHNSRTPDIIVVPEEGAIYTSSGKKNAEHGGFNEDDVHVGLVIANPHIIPGVVHEPVHTTQVAPTILKELDLEPGLLHSVRAEGTEVLPGIHFDGHDAHHHGLRGDG